MLSTVEVKTIQESVASLEKSAKKLSFDELGYQDRLIQVSKVDNILKTLEKRLTNPKYNKTKVQARITELNQYKKKLFEHLQMLL